MSTVDLVSAPWPHDECPSCGDSQDVQPIEEGTLLYCTHCRVGYAHRPLEPWELAQAWEAHQP